MGDHPEPFVRRAEPQAAAQLVAPATGELLRPVAKPVDAPLPDPVEVVSRYRMDAYAGCSRGHAKQTNDTTAM